jgi:hypothetical protein
MILCPISLGELVDKITILKIKMLKITDQNKLSNVKKEYVLLSELLQKNGLSEENAHFVQLYDLNLKFWEYHDWQRQKWSQSQRNTIDEELYWKNKEEHILNDKRAEIKKNINTLYASEIIEEKQFIGYAI